MVHTGPRQRGDDRVLVHGRLFSAHARVLHIKEFDHLGIPLMDEDLLHEGLAQKVWLPV